MTVPSRNLEIKAFDPDPAATLEVTLSLGAQDRGMFAQRDTYFFAATGRLKLRDTDNGSAELISYTRPDQPGPKVSDCRVVPVVDVVAMEAALRDVRATHRLRSRIAVAVLAEADRVEHCRDHRDRSDTANRYGDVVRDPVAHGR